MLFTRTCPYGEQLVDNLRTCPNAVSALRRSLSRTYGLHIPSLDGGRSPSLAVSHWCPGVGSSGYYKAPSTHSPPFTHPITNQVDLDLDVCCHEPSVYMIRKAGSRAPRTIVHPHYPNDSSQFLSPHRAPNFTRCKSDTSTGIMQQN